MENPRFSSVNELSVINEETENSKTKNRSPRTSPTHVTDAENQIIAIVKKSFVELGYIWDRLGITGDLRQERLLSVAHHHENLQNEMLKEEQATLIRYEDKVCAGSERLVTLMDELGIEDFKMLEDVSKLPVIEQDAVLAEKVLHFQGQKDVLVKQLKDSCEKVEDLCVQLGHDDKCLSDPKLLQMPIQHQINDLGKKIEELEFLKSKRLDDFQALKGEIQSLLLQLEKDLLSPLEEELSTPINVDNIMILSEDTFAKILSLRRELENQLVHNQQVFGELQAKLRVLYDCLSVADRDRMFPCNLVECDSGSLKMLESLSREVKKYQAMKAENMALFIDRLRKDLLVWWDKCLVSSEEKEAFVAFHDDSLTDGLFELHEAELFKWKDFYKSNSTIFDLINKRQQLWEKMLFFEQKANDPSRYHNRGGNLLQEEKDKKGILVRMPRLEEKLFEEVRVFEEENGVPFTMWGEPVKEFCNRQWTEHAKEKEEIKQQRLLKKLEDNQSVPTTPSKRHHMTIAQTPSRTPAKHPRLQITTCKSPLNVGKGLNRQAPTPQSSTKNTPRFKGPKNMKSPLKKALRSAVNPEIAVSDSTLNYSQFVSGVVGGQKINTRSTLTNSISASSFVANSSRRSGRVSKPVLASKLSPKFNNNGSVRSRKSIGKNGLLNASKRLATTRRLRSSGQAKSPVKLTAPVRGKLGLPFLI